MLELRKDYFLERWVIISTERAKRPLDFRKEAKLIVQKKDCPFCPGNEHMTPPETASVKEGGHWVLRAFQNRFPAVMQRGSSKIITENEIFTHANAFGSHEVIVETPEHSEQLGDMSTERIAKVMEFVRQRVSALRKIDGVKQVIAFKNHGPEAGTSIEHEHFQVIAFNTPPENISKEADAAEVFERGHGKCPYCKIIELESKGQRRIFENKSFFSYAPYASRFAFEAMVVPKEHKLRFSEFSGKEMLQLAESLKKILSKLKELNAPYNFYFHESPEGKNLHFHVKITPRVLSWGGFEFGTGTIINTVPPEDAAKFYRGQK